MSVVVEVLELVVDECEMVDAFFEEIDCKCGCCGYGECAVVGRCDVGCICAGVAEVDLVEVVDVVVGECVAVRQLLATVD